MFSIIAMNFFQLAAEQNGYLMAYFGVVQMVSSEAPWECSSTPATIDVEEHGMAMTCLS